MVLTLDNINTAHYLSDFSSRLSQAFRYPKDHSLLKYSKAYTSLTVIVVIVSVFPLYYLQK